MVKDLGSMFDRGHGRSTSCGECIGKVPPQWVQAVNQKSNKKGSEARRGPRHGWMGCPWLLNLFGNKELRGIFLPWHWRHVDGTPNGLQAHLAHWECPGWARGRRASTWLQPGVCTNGTSFKGDQVMQAPSRTAEVPKDQKAESVTLRDAKSTESTKSTKRKNTKVQKVREARSAEMKKVREVPEV